MSYWKEARTWLQKAERWTVFTIFVVSFPFAVFVSFAYNFTRSYSPWRRSRVVKDNVVIVTGASSGIGQCIALEYAKRGAKLVLAARREEKLKEVAKMCEASGAQDAAICLTDVSKPEDCKNLIQFAVETFGRVDVLVNNAGTAQISAFEDCANADDFRKSVDVNFWGNILTTKYALEHLQRTHGQVVVTCSVGAFVPYPKQSFYNASNAALLSFYDTLRVEPIAEKVTITVALPSFVVSEMTSRRPSGHIPRWCPMMKTTDCARKIVDAAIANRRYAIVPFWCSSNLWFRVLAPEVLETLPRMLLLGKPPNKMVKWIFHKLIGEEATQKGFQSLTALT